MIKPMIYQVNRKEPPEILVSDSYKGLDYYILDLGTHPCAYVEVADTKINNIDYPNIDLECHGGLTYSASRLIGIDKIGWYIGWDYSHYGDYLGYERLFPELLPSGGKRWTTEEIILECKSVISEIEKRYK